MNYSHTPHFTAIPATKPENGWRERRWREMESGVEPETRGERRGVVLEKEGKREREWMGRGKRSEANQHVWKGKEWVQKGGMSSLFISSSISFNSIYTVNSLQLHFIPFSTPTQLTSPLSNKLLSTPSFTHSHIKSNYLFQTIHKHNHSNQLCLAHSTPLPRSSPSKANDVLLHLIFLFHPSK